MSGWVGGFCLGEWVGWLVGGWASGLGGGFSLGVRMNLKLFFLLAQPMCASLTKMVKNKHKARH